MSEDIPNEAAASTQGGGGAHLKIDIAGIGAIEQDNRRVTGSDQGSSNLNNETGRGVTLCVKGEGAG